MWGSGEMLTTMPFFARRIKWGWRSSSGMMFWGATLNWNLNQQEEKNTFTGVSITLVISGHWRCNRRPWPLKGPCGPFPLGGCGGMPPPPKKNWNLEARKCDFQRSGHQKACCWWEFLLTAKHDFFDKLFFFINIIFIFINKNPNRRR